MHCNLKTKEKLAIFLCDKVKNSCDSLEVLILVNFKRACINACCVHFIMLWFILFIALTMAIKSSWNISIHLHYLVYHCFLKTRYKIHFFFFQFRLQKNFMCKIFFQTVADQEFIRTGSSGSGVKFLSFCFVFFSPSYNVNRRSSISIQPETIISLRGSGQ